MIVKNQQFKDKLIGVWEEQIYSNVERVYRIKDKNEDEFIQLKIKGQDLLETIPVTHIDENGNHPSLTGAIWLMNDDGKTIERLV